MGAGHCGQYNSSDFEVIPCVWKMLRVQFWPNDNCMEWRVGWRSTGEEQKRKLKMGQVGWGGGLERPRSPPNQVKELASLCRS